MSEFDFNPFQELYVTDSAPPKLFVSLFSDVPVKNTHFLFQPGNVVLKGTQGCGKSMLLNLFRPEIRKAYHDANEPFPVPRPLRGFIGAGVNLAKSGLLDVGQIALHADPERDKRELPFYFADLLNYWLLRDLLDTLDYMACHSQVFDGLVRPEHYGRFVESIVRGDCWFGYLDDCRSIEDLRKRVAERVAAYRRWLSANGDLPPEIHKTKTVISEPIARTVESLKEAKVIPAGAPVFLRIDQIEELHRSHKVPQPLGPAYRRLINRALGNRDQRVSYRVGTRRYCWEDDLVIHGSGGRLEEGRDYKLIDLDKLFRPGENTRNLFSKFAEDAFARRVTQLEDGATGAGVMARNPAHAAFGSTPTAEEVVDRLMPNKAAINAERLLALGDDWPMAWREFLIQRFAQDPLDAVLAAAWALQSGGKRRAVDRRDEPPPAGDPPWHRVWWRKERLWLGVMQLAARHKQRMLWWGFKKVLALSSANIGIFLRISHEVWDHFLRDQRGRAQDQRYSPLGGKRPIDPQIQAVAINNASAEWHTKIAEQPGGDVRRRFIDEVGQFLRKKLLDDRAMSYPGRNGFSLAITDLEQIPALDRFLSEAVGYGDLYEVEHTTKEKDRRPRRKYYLNPILSPHYQLPEAHTKEPYYASAREIADLALTAKVPLSMKAGDASSGNDAQLALSLES